MQDCSILRTFYVKVHRLNSASFVKCHFDVLTRCRIMCRDQAADHGYDPLLQPTVAADWSRGKDTLLPLQRLTTLVQECRIHLFESQLFSNVCDDRN